MKGTIKWYNTRKGYGSILSENNQDVFVRQTNIPSETILNDGENVEFDIEKSERGSQTKKFKEIIKFF
jgi:CspA family cold shock protein